MLNVYHYYLSQEDIDAVGGLIAHDEEFRPVKGVRSLFVSNYGRIISKRSEYSRVLKTHFFNGYNSITLENVRNGKKIRKCYYVHNLVARAFLPIPNWIKDGDIVETHHKEKVDKQKYNPASDYLENLALLPQCIHRTIDNIRKIEVFNGTRWKSMPFLEIAEYYGISPYDLHDFIKKRRRKNRLEKYKTDIYEGSVKQGNSLIDLKVRVHRYK